MSSVTSGFFNGIDRSYDSSQISNLFDGLIQDGIFQSIGTYFAVVADGGLIVKVGIGRAWFNHTWTYNDAILPIPADDSELILDRIDAVVIEVNSLESIRENTIKIIKGIPSSTPVNPTLTNTDYVHQHVLAYIYRSAGSTEITQANITNMVGTASTPFVTGIVQTANLDDLLGQWQGQLDEFVTDQTGEFTTWFDQIKDQLSADAAANLQLQIGTLSTLTTTVKTSLVLAINSIITERGALSALTTDVKSTLVAAINEILTKVKDSLRKWLNTLVTTSAFVAYCGPAYVPASTYQIGALVVSGNRIWKCIVANTTGTWDSTKWAVQPDIPQEIELYGKGYLYRAEIACVDVRDTDIPNVIFSVTNAEEGNYAPICNSYIDKVYIYAKSIPLAAITIPTIYVEKVVA